MLARAIQPAERSRTLQQVTFAASSILTRDLPRDTVLKALQLRLSGSVVTTFGSGTPVADAFSTFDNLVPRIDVVVNGSMYVKSVRPWLMHMQQLLASKIIAERKSSAGASAATGNNPTADAGFTYGTTTQVTTVAESILVSFEHPLALVGKESTWLNLKGVSSAEIRFNTAAFSSLLGFGNTAPVAYSSSTLVIDIATFEAQDIPAEVEFSIFKQSTKEVTFSAETTESPIDINRGNFVSGIHFLARDGAAGSATTASGKLRSNLAIRALKLVKNGQENVKAFTSFLQLQADNRSRYGLSAPYASNVSLLDGYAFMDLLRNRDLNTALDARQPETDNLQAFLTTSNATDVSYTNPVSVTIMTDEIIKPR